MFMNRISFTSIEFIKGQVENLNKLNTFRACHIIYFVFFINIDCVELVNAPHIRYIPNTWNSGCIQHGT